MKRRTFLKGLAGCIAATQAPAILARENVMDIFVPKQYANIVTLGDLSAQAAVKQWGVINGPYSTIQIDGGLVIGDSIEISGSGNPANNGLYKVASIDGAGKTITLENGYEIDKNAAELIREGGWQEIGGEPLGGGVHVRKHLLNHEYGMIIDADGKSIEELYEEVKHATREAHSLTRDETDLYPGWKSFAGGQRCGKTFALDKKLKIS